MTEQNRSEAKPFLKWAGGKSQLLSQFEAFYPEELKQGRIKKYVEPFIGGGAVFFEVVQNYNVKSAVLNDVNEELVIAYRVVQKDPETLFDFLNRLSKQYKRMSETERRGFFYEIRSNYNRQRFQINYKKYSENWIPRAAQLIFLNKTCFNGLFRLNQKGEFNVPFGRYENPTILNKNNLLNVSRILQMTEIRSVDFEACEKFVDDHSFVYFDPPYRPISRSSSFTSYAKNNFGDEEQQRLGHFFARLNKKSGARLMLSNSDPKNKNPHDDFFEELYMEFKIRKVSANRMINSKAEKRGPINELLITNY